MQFNGSESFATWCQFSIRSGFHHAAVMVVKQTSGRLVTLTRKKPSNACYVSDVWTRRSSDSIEPIFSQLRFYRSFDFSLDLGRVAAKGRHQLMAIH